MSRYVCIVADPVNGGERRFGRDSKREAFKDTREAAKSYSPTAIGVVEYGIGRRLYDPAAGTRIRRWDRSKSGKLVRLF